MKKMKFILLLIIINIFCLNICAQSHEELFGSESIGWHLGNITNDYGTFYHTHIGSSSTYLDYKFDSNYPDALKIHFFNAVINWRSKYYQNDYLLGQNEMNLNSSSLNLISYSGEIDEDTIAGVLKISKDSNNHLTRWKLLVGYRFESRSSYDPYNKRQLALTHEIGHIIGLKDLYETYNSSKIMYGYMDFESNQPISISITDTDALGYTICRDEHNHGTLSPIYQWGPEHHAQTCPLCQGSIVTACTLSIPATCIQGASCICGHADTNINPNNHNDPSTWNTNNDQHWKACTWCYRETTRTDHYYNNLSCTSVGTCVCGRTKSALGHNWATTYTYDSSQHWYPCFRCLLAGTKTNHNKAYYYYNSSQHRYGCLTCNYVESTSNHSYGSPQYYNGSVHKEVCTTSGCNATNYISHSWVYPNYDANQHYQRCSCGYGYWTSHDSGSCPCGYNPPSHPPCNFQWSSYYNYTQSVCYTMEYKCSICNAVDWTVTGGHSPPPDYSWGNYTCLDCGMTVYGV